MRHKPFLLAGLAGALFLGPGPAHANTQNAAPTAGTEVPSANRFEDVEALMDKVENLNGQKVAVSGEVDDIAGTTFVLEGGGIINDEIVVVLGKGMEDAQKGLVADDSEIQIEGTIHQGRLVDASGELGVNFDSDLRDRLNKVQQYLVAEKITRKAE